MKFSIALSLISPIFWPCSKLEIYAYSRPKTQNFLLFSLRILGNNEMLCINYVSAFK